VYLTRTRGRERAGAASNVDAPYETLEAAASRVEVDIRLLRRVAPELKQRIAALCIESFSRDKQSGAVQPSTHRAKTW
jgi:hypothetical protein